MGLIDDIKNLQPLSNEVITKEKLIKTLNDIFKDVEQEHKLLQTFEQACATKVYKQVGVGKYEFVGFDLGIKNDCGDIVITTPNGCKITINEDNINDFIIGDDDISKIVKTLKKELKINKNSKVIYQREKVEQDDDERRNAI